MKNKSLKSLLALLTLASSLIFAYEAVAQTDKSSVQISEQSRKDQDLKLSIEELRKKYPISLLDKKKKSYKAGQKINIDDYSMAEIKAAFLNADRNFISKKNVKGRGVENADGSSFWVDEEVSIKNQQELILIEKACDKIRHSGWSKDWSKLNKKWKNLFFFIFSDDLPISYYTIKYVSPEAGFCLNSVEDARGT